VTNFAGEVESSAAAQKEEKRRTLEMGCFNGMGKAARRDNNCFSTPCKQLRVETGEGSVGGWKVARWHLFPLMTL
jgi:hypothetical protein